MLPCGIIVMKYYNAIKMKDNVVVKKKECLIYGNFLREMTHIFFAENSLENKNTP